MRPALAVDPPRCLLLDPVVADCGSGCKTLFDVTRLQEVLFEGGVRPDARETVRLKLEANRELVCLVKF